MSECIPFVSLRLDLSFLLPQSHSDPPTSSLLQSTSQIPEPHPSTQHPSPNSITMTNSTHLENASALSTPLPNPDGFFGESYGGAFVPPQLTEPMKAVEAGYHKCKEDPAFLAELSELRKRFIGRPSPIYHCKNLSRKLGGE